MPPSNEDRSWTFCSVLKVFKFDVGKQKLDAVQGHYSLFSIQETVLTFSVPSTVLNQKIGESISGCFSFNFVGDFLVKHKLLNLPDEIR